MLRCYQLKKHIINIFNVILMTTKEKPIVDTQKIMKKESKNILTKRSSNEKITAI